MERRSALRLCAALMALMLALSCGGALASSLTKEQELNAQYTLMSLALTQGKYEKALTYADACLAAEGLTDDIHAELLMKKGYALIFLNRTDEAMECLDESLTIDPALGDAILLRMQLFVSVGDANRAFDEAERYLSVLPDQLAVYTTLGELFAAAGAYADAVLAYTDFIDRSDGVSAFGHQMRGQYLLQTGRYEDAVADLTLAIDAEPDTIGARAYYLRAIALMQLGEYDRAIEDLSVGVAAVEAEAAAGDTASLDADVALSRYYRAISAMQIGRYQEAVADLDACVEAGVNKEYATFWRGACLLETAEYERARKDFEACIEAEIETAASRYYIGLCQMGLAQYEAAIETFTLCVGEKQQTKQALYNRGMCYLQLGQEEKGQADLEASIAIE